MGAAPELARSAGTSSSNVGDNGSDPTEKSREQEGRQTQKRQGRKRSTRSGATRRCQEVGEDTEAARAASFENPLFQGDHSGFDEALQVQERHGRSEAREDRYQHGSW